MRKKVIAILCADLHLSHRPPVWRSNEPDWYAAMARPLFEMEQLRQQYKHSIVLCAGDVFDRWNSCPETINFAMANLPGALHTLPGQHDIPNHSLTELNRSAYMSLEYGRTIKPLPFGIGSIITIGEIAINVTSFPYGITLTRCTPKWGVDINIAMVHEYIWTGKHKYTDAPKEAELKTRTKLLNGKLHGYDVIVYGDNHKGFLTEVGNTTIFNCGTMMRRKSDEEDYKPQVGLLYSDGSVEPHYLDTSQDKHLTTDETGGIINKEIDLEVFADELKKLGGSALDFTEALHRFCKANNVKSSVHKIIQQAMETENE